MNTKTKKIFPLTGEWIKHSDYLGILLFLIVLWLVFGIGTPNFATLNNLNVILQGAMITAVVGLAQMVIIGTGGMNLSVGAIGGLSAILCASTMEKGGAPAILAILTGLAVGGICGLVNGVIIALMGGKGSTSFLVTLATSFLFQGITYGYTEAASIFNLSSDFVRIGTSNFLGIPVMFFAMLVITFLCWYLFRFLGIGRQILAFGSNVKAAELYGINIRKTVVTANVISGLLAAAAGVMLCARLGSGMVNIGEDWLMFSFAAPIIGGTRQAGGRVLPWGTVIGAVILATIENGLIHLNLDVYWMELIQGIIIMLAVVLDAWKNHRDGGK